MSRVLIIGASRGIGLGLVDVHLGDRWKVHATTRDGSRPRDHQDLMEHRLDVRDVDQLKKMIEELREPVDRVIHNAGVLRASRAEIMEINAEAPIRTVERLIAEGSVAAGGSIAIVTSQLGARRGRTGSLGDYGDSKAALNDEFRSRAPRWGEHAVCVVIHPGWVQTDMGGRGASITITESAAGIKAVMDSLTAQDNGSFLTWDGRIHPW